MKIRAALLMLPLVVLLGWMLYTIGGWHGVGFGVAWFSALGCFVVGMDYLR